MPEENTVPLDGPAAVQKNPTFNEPEQLKDAMMAALAAHKHIPKWPLDRVMQPVEGPEDMERLRGAGLMAGCALMFAMEKKAALDKVSQDLASTMNGFGHTGLTSAQLMQMGGVEDPMPEAYQQALKILLAAPGAPRSWGDVLPGGGTALDFFPQGRARVALEAFLLSEERKAVDKERGNDAPMAQNRAKFRL